MGKIIGIDLGTTYSAVARYDETGRPFIVVNKDGKNITPTCVALEDDGTVFTGLEAKKQWNAQPDKAATRFKRKMGREGAEYVLDNQDSYTPTQLSAAVLQHLLNESEDDLSDLTRVVITVPANFKDEARTETLQAGVQAGIDPERIHLINEPTAAAIYFGWKMKEALAGNYAVYDLGGGTFDVTIVKVSDTAEELVTVLASDGIEELGGMDFDLILQELVFENYKEKTGKQANPLDFSLGDAEVTKRSLSVRDKAKCKVGRVVVPVSRSDFEEKISDLVSQIEMKCDVNMANAGLEPSDLAGVFLVGGSTRMPCIERSVKNVYEMEPTKFGNPDEVVALGAALWAAKKSQAQGELTPTQDKGVEDFSVAEVINEFYGTLVLMHTEARGQVLVNDILLGKGDRIPATCTRDYLTVYEGQEAINCKVTESRTKEQDPRFVKVLWEGELELPSGRSADQKIQVTFNWDASGILGATFTDVESGRVTVGKVAHGASEAAGNTLLIEKD
jgi:molecular chaperone DnaK